jgi:hypothetical protein
MSEPDPVKLTGFARLLNGLVTGLLIAFGAVVAFLVVTRQI